MSERDYTKSPFDFDLPAEPLEADWMDPFRDIPTEALIDLTESRPGDLFRDVRHGNSTTFPMNRSQNDETIGNTKAVRYGKLNWTISK